MNVHRSKIEWCTHTWNPVTGCRHGCPYCYARRFAARFQPHACEWPEEDYKAGRREPLQRPEETLTVSDRPVRLVDSTTGEYIRSTPYPVGFEPTFHKYKLDHVRRRILPARIFVSSMGDLFGDWVPDDWIKQVFDACKEVPQHVYYFLTKNPNRYTELHKKGLLPEDENFWYGSSTPTPETPFWWSRQHNSFVSIEPLHAPYDNDGATALIYTGWVIIGAETGPGSRQRQPKREWVENIVKACAEMKVPVFMKDSLEGIWGQPLIREYPEGMVKPGTEKTAPQTRRKPKK